VIMVSEEGPGISGREMKPKKRDSHREIAPPTSAQKKMMTSGMRRPAGVLIKASAATNTPTIEKSRWPDTVHLSDLERRVPAERARPDSTRYTETGRIIAMKGGMVSRSIPERLIRYTAPPSPAIVITYKRAISSFLRGEKIAGVWGRITRSAIKGITQSPPVRRTTITGFMPPGKVGKNGPAVILPVMGVVVPVDDRS